MKKITVTVLSEKEYEEYTCACGNHSGLDGFFPCDEEGTLIEPTKNSGWFGLYICAQCGNLTMLKTNPLQISSAEAVDYPLLYEQKRDLVARLWDNPNDPLWGLVNYLDAQLDKAEEKGLFICQEEPEA